MAVDVLLKGFPMIPLSCRSNLAGRYLLRSQIADFCSCYLFKYFNSSKETYGSFLNFFTYMQFFGGKYCWLPYFLKATSLK
jgi:hypothetical protein